ncbi:MAG TPA: amino acid permease [Gemmatimonadaceae bacterium]
MELKRTLGLRDLVLIVIGTVIGSGIFIVPATTLQQAGGRVGVALLVWLVAGVLSLLGALTYGEMGAMNPDAGGLYVYIRDAFGELPAFLYGWTALLVIASGSCATLAVAFSAYLGQIVPLSGLAAKAISVLMIATTMVLNVRGTRQSADVQNWTTGLKATALVVMSVVLLLSGHHGGATVPTAVSQPAHVSFSMFATAMIGVLWAYEGWQYATFAAGETREPRRTFPRGIIVGTACIIGIYILANLGYIAALGPVRAAHSQRIAAEAVGALLGPIAGKVIAAIILVSMFSAANGIALTAPRLYYSMARDGVFFRKLAEVHPRFGTPAVAVVSCSVWAMFLAATGSFEQLFTYVVFVGWIFYALGGVAIFVYRKRQPNALRPFRVPGYPITPLLFVAAAAAVVVNTVVTQPGRAALGLIVTAVGVPVFFMWRQRLTIYTWGSARWRALREALR